MNADARPNERSPCGRRTLIAAALLGATAVLMGAFGAHALRERLTPSALDWYGTAVDYQTTHALALLTCGLLALYVQGSTRMPDHLATPTLRLLRLGALCLLGGTALFAGSLYLMAFTGWTRLGMITPLGGVALIAGWLAMAAAAWRLR